MALNGVLGALANGTAALRDRFGLREPTEDEILDGLIHQDKDKLDELKFNIRQQEITGKERKNEIEEIECQIEHTRNELLAVEQDLAATRTHALDEGAMPKELVIKEFIDFIQRIKLVVDALHAHWDSHRDRGLSQYRAEAIREHLRKGGAHPDAEKFVRMAIGQQKKLTVWALMRHCACHTLIANVFDPFMPGTDKDNEANRFLLEVQSNIQCGEAQDVSGRWRALTYKHAMLDSKKAHDWRTSNTKRFSKWTSDLMAMATGEKMSEQSFNDLQGFIWDMFGAAAEFKRRAFMSCTDADTLVYLPLRGQGFDLGQMKEAYGGERCSNHVILGIRLGLILGRSALEGTEYVQHVYHRIYAGAIGDESKLVAPLS